MRADGWRDGFFDETALADEPPPCSPPPCSSTRGGRPVRARVASFPPWARRC